MISIQSIYETGLVLFAIKNPGARFVAVMMLITFSINMLQKFSKNSEKIYLKKVKYMVYYLSLFLFLRSFVTQILSVEIFGEFLKKIPLLSVFVKSKAAKGSHFLLLLSLCVRDALAIDNFLKIKMKYTEESDLKDKIGTICHLYEKNDRKIYERVVLMMKNDNLQDHIHRFLNSQKGLKDMKVDTEYYKTDIRDNLIKVRYDYLSKYYSPLKLTVIRLLERFYKFLTKHSNTPYHQHNIGLLQRSQQRQTEKHKLLQEKS